MKKTLLHFKPLKSISIITFILGAIFLIFSFIIHFLTPNINIQSNLQQSTISLEKLSQELSDKCKTNKHPPTCYEKELPKLMDPPNSLTMEQAFEVTHLVQTLDQSYGYCHVVGHKLSQKQVQEDPANWKQVITMCPSEGCANGCIHGVFMEKFNTEQLNESQLKSLEKDIGYICRKNDMWQPTSVESSGCFHALGHAVMYLTGADINRSIEFCRVVGQRDDGINKDIYNCFQGAFMQIFQPLEAEDKALVKDIRPDKDNVIGFCSRFTDSAKTTCLNQSWPYFFREFKYPAGLNQYCTHFASEDKEHCFYTAINILTSNLNLDTEFMLNYCSQLSIPTPGWCLGQSAGRMLEISLTNLEKAVDMCERGKSFDHIGQCYVKLITASRGVYKDQASRENDFCSKLPNTWQQTCLEN